MSLYREIMDNSNVQIIELLKGIGYLIIIALAPVALGVVLMYLVKDLPWYVGLAVYLLYLFLVCCSTVIIDTYFHWEKIRELDEQ